MLNKCPECGSSDIEIQTQNAECHCRNCGLVVEDEIIDYGHFREGTSISSPSIKEGKIVKSAWLLSSREKNILNAKNKLDLIESRLNLPDYIKNESLELYKRAVEKGICIGRDNHSIMLACVYASCNQYTLPKTAIEIAEYSEITSFKLIKSYNLLKKELELRINNYDPIDLLPRFISRLNLSIECLNKAIEIIEKIKGTSFYSGKNPKTIIATVIYLAAKQNNEQITQRHIANEVGVMEVTIRRRYKEIIKQLESNT